MTDVLVTGGNGFIGRFVTAVLSERGHRPAVLDRHRRAGMANTQLGDVRDAAQVAQAVAGAEGVIHLAGVLGTQETLAHPDLAAEVNVLGTLHVLEACHRFGVPLVNISVGNYWMRNPYAITKMAAEQLALMYAEHHGDPVAVVRGLNAYGPGQEPAAPYGASKVRKLVPALLARAIAGHPMELYGDGSQVMDMIYVRDLAEVLVTALLHLLGGGRLPYVVEAGSGIRTSVLDVAHLVNKAVEHHGRPPVSIDHLPMRPGEPDRAEVLADTTSLAPLGIDPDAFTPLGQGLIGTADWLLRHPR